MTLDADDLNNMRKLLAFVESAASLCIDGDIVDGEEYIADGNDDEIDALYALVHDARELLGLDDPMMLRS